MSEEASQSESVPDTFVSPLRSILTEFHEIYQELKAVGFTEQVATGIVAQMLSDVLSYRAVTEDDGDFDEDDNDDESDDDNERGLD